MAALPDELLLDLFLALGDSRAIVDVAEVCRWFARVAQDGVLQRRLKRRWSMKSVWCSRSLGGWDGKGYRLPCGSLHGTWVVFDHDDYVSSMRRYEEDRPTGLWISWLAMGSDRWISGVRYVGESELTLCGNGELDPGGGPAPDAWIPIQ